MLGKNVGVVGFIIMVMICSFLLSGEIEASSWGLVGGIMRYIPLQTVKIVIAAWQILTQARGFLKVIAVASILCPQ